MSWKGLLFVILLALEAICFLGFYLTKRIDSFRFWPPPHAWSIQSIIVRLISVILFGLVVVVGWLDYGTLTWPVPGLSYLAYLLFPMGIGFVVWGIGSLGYEDFAGTGNELQTEGIYSYSRNPQYLGHILICIGFILYVQSVLVLVSGVLGILLFLYVPFVEEDYLRDAFGKEYEDYLEDVPRFF